MKKYLLFIVLAIALGVGAGLWMYNKPHQNIQKSKADITLEATELFAAFDTDEAAANTKFLDKIVQVSGTVKEVSTDEEGQVSITLDAGDDFFGGVICKLDALSEHKRVAFEVGEQVTLKGFCTGVLMDVIIVRCVEV